MTCFFCKGNLKDSTTNHFVDLNFSMIIIKGVPCRKCDQCGEVVYSGIIVRRIEQIVDTLKNSLTEIAIVNYSEKIA